MTTAHLTDTLSLASLAEIAAFAGQPCVSLYQSTHRSHPKNQQDPIRFNNLLKELHASLLQQEVFDAAHTLLDPLTRLGQDHDFWQHMQDGLAVLAAPGFFRVFLLQRPVPDLAVVADSFHTKPLRQYVQSSGRYQVLALSLDQVRLFEGNRNALDGVTLAASVPQSIADAPGDGPAGAHSTVASYGGIGSGHTAMHHGQVGKKDAMDTDAERLFRAVDRAVLEHHSQPSGLPLILAALPEHQHQFRAVSYNPFLMASGLLADPQSLALDDLRLCAWEVVQPEQAARQAAWIAAYAAAAAHGLGSEDLPAVAKAAVAGRVAVLLVEAGHQVAGRIDPLTGQTARADIGDPQVDDMLEDLGTLVETMGGVVHVLPAERMPSRTGLAASFRH